MIDEFGKIMAKGEEAKVLNLEIINSLSDAGYEEIDSVGNNDDGEFFYTALDQRNYPVELVATARRVFGGVEMTIIENKIQQK